MGLDYHAMLAYGVEVPDSEIDKFHRIKQAVTQSQPRHDVRTGKYLGEEDVQISPEVEGYSFSDQEELMDIYEFMDLFCERLGADLREVNPPYDSRYWVFEPHYDGELTLELLPELRGPADDLFKMLKRVLGNEELEPPALKAHLDCS